MAKIFEVSRRVVVVDLRFRGDESIVEKAAVARIGILRQHEPGHPAGLSEDLVHIRLGQLDQLVAAP